MTTPFTVLGIDHVVLRTAQPARLENFYVEVLGCPVEKRQEKIGLTQLRAGRSLIDIVALDPGTVQARDAPSAANMDHLCLRIDPFDVAAIRKHLAGHGVACGDAVPRYGAEGSGLSLYIEDPDGNRVELKGPPSTA